MRDLGIPEIPIIPITHIAPIGPTKKMGVVQYYSHF